MNAGAVSALRLELERIQQDLDCLKASVLSWKRGKTPSNIPSCRHVSRMQRANAKAENQAASIRRDPWIDSLIVTAFRLHTAAVSFAALPMTYFSGPVPKGNLENGLVWC
jgi:hypothetical protein